MHTSPNMLGAYLCQISAFKSNNKCEFLAWKTKKQLKNSQIWFFFAVNWSNFMSNAWNFAQRPPSVLSIRTKKELTKFQNILRVNGKSSKNEKSKFCKNLYLRLIFEKSFKIFLTPLETILHTHIYSHAKFCGTALTIRHKKNLKSLEK